MYVCMYVCSWYVRIYVCVCVYVCIYQLRCLNLAVRGMEETFYFEESSSEPLPKQ